MSKIIEIIITAISIIFVLVTHEYAHGLVAYWNGDYTAKRNGRLSLNPLKHLDPIGTISMILFKFGWAKPVPVNPNNYENTRLGMFTVSIAGILVNLITALIAMIFLRFVTFNQYLLFFFNNLIIYGIILAVFNLIPIPPLDGSKVLASFLPYSFSNFMNKYEKYSFFLLLILLATGFIPSFIIPIVNTIYNFFIDISILVWG